MLNIQKTKEDDYILYQLEGRLDTVTAPELEESLQEALEETNDLVLDFEKLDYISSAGLRVLLSAQKIIGNQGTMKVTHVNDTIMEIFEVTGFNEILTIE
jgi:anti-sigma B factor antagonist